MGAVLNYLQSITDAMTALAEHPKTLFVGQSVKYDGQRAHQTFAGVPIERRIEMPICEDFTVGFCTGLALEGYIPICFIPRWDFLILAANQIINHLDKFPMLGEFRPKVIIRTAVGTNRPLDPGPQHTQDYTGAFAAMLRTMDVYQVHSAFQVRETYKHVMQAPESCIVVERMEYY